jgi:hypothetical protein
MNRYSYAYFFNSKGDRKTLHFPSLPEIDAAMQTLSDSSTIEARTRDLVLTVLQRRIASRRDIPQGEDPALVQADGFVILSVQQAMKLELFRLYRANSRSISEFSRMVNMRETPARRLFNLRHQSRPTEIEAAIEVFGKRLVHSWDIEHAVPASPARRSSSPSMRP